MLGDSRARALVVSEALWPQFEGIVGKHKTLKHVIVSGKDGKGRLLMAELMAKASANSNRRRPPATISASGCIPPAPPVRPRARCTCTRT
jgi:hypothetical protein